MRTDRWITGTETEQGEADGQARSSVWIDPVVQQNISASYLTSDKKKQEGKPGTFPLRNPTTPIPPIPPRASTNPSNAVKVRPRYPRSYVLSEDSDVTRIPTRPQPTMWQYETPDYEAESSLSSLSLIADALPPKEPENKRRTIRLSIDEIDTLPPEVRHQEKPLQPKKQPRAFRPAAIDQRRASVDLAKQDTAPIAAQSLVLRTPRGIDEIDKIDTVPPGAATVAVPLMPYSRRALPAVRTPSTIFGSDARSWTAGRGANSLYAQRLINDRKKLKGKSTLHLSPLDHTRWWLLYPGRIEFLLWLGGTITLMTVTCIFLFVGVLSFGWMGPGAASGGATFSSGTTTNTQTNTPVTGCIPANGKQCRPGTTATLPPSSLHPIVEVVTQGLMIPGLPIHLQGQGFSPKGRVLLTHDNNLPCQPQSISADIHGVFLVEILVGTGADWKAGMHILTAYDTVDKHTALAQIVLAPAPFGKGAPPTPAPPPAGVTPTAPVGVPTAVNQTPVPITPTVGITPTVTVPKPTPTAGITPTPTKTVPTPTPGITPTVGATPTKTSHVEPVQVISLNADASNQHLSMSIWLWIVFAGYALAMLMLGIAGILYRRNRAK